MWVDRFSSHVISVKKVEKDSGDPTIAVLTCYGPHNRKPGQRVRVVSGVPKAGSEAYFSRTLNPYEFGLFDIIAQSGISAPNVLKYQMTQAPSVGRVQDTPCIPPNTLDDPPACIFDTVFLGPDDIGFSTDGGSEAVAEGNRVFNCGTGGSYHDTFGTKDQTDRNNYYSDVWTGPYQNMGRASELKAGSLSISGTSATFQADNDHGLVVGQAVRFFPPLGNPAQEYFAVTTVPTSDSFTFEVSGTVTLIPPYTFGALWQVRLAIRENNVIELGRAEHAGTGYGYSSAIPFYSGPHPSQYVFRAVIIANNIIRIISGSSNASAKGIEILDTERALVEGNIIDLLVQPGMNISGSRSLQFFNNQTPSGVLLRPTLIPPTDAVPDDLAIQVEEDFFVAL